MSLEVSMETGWWGYLSIVKTACVLEFRVQSTLTKMELADKVFV